MCLVVLVNIFNFDTVIVEVVLAATVMDLFTFDSLKDPSYM